MSLTLLYRGKNVRFSMKLNKFHWLSAITVFAVISGFVVHLFMSADAVPNSSTFTVKSPTKEPEALTVSKQQVTALTMKLAELQSQVLRLNALGDRLAEEANIPAKEFNFQDLPPSGGPIEQTLSSQTKTLAELLADITSVESSLAFEEKQLNLLESLTLGHHIENTSYLSGRPITKGWLSSYFGTRKDPFTGRPAMHKGVDFAGKEDAEIIATAAGVVSWASRRYGYGNLIEINHGKGLKTRYGHNKEILVKIGDVVSKGQVIARMGSTGRSTGPHVHYEILRNNKQIDPIKYVYRKAK
ncbi:M23 family metallopeptidase [Thalassotalea sp. 1_MG-2023]|uniref:M23 family metallopeptidase n=1 Tax=Thalassotalea sp. 1_MG-2023 TaxID=3062680 RepID=UPI0026E47848|nr:M23 family metallopeptidase [Thalassotalea sp. 1_MG-2023]MDO6427190.1 M23 family metallopeptidase [Thalassotalea sp. 1_MG-2023]